MRIISRRRCCALALATSAACTQISKADPFYMGGDVSLLPFIEGAGGVFRDGGQVRPLEQIMVNHGDNLFRLRLFVNPNTNYNATAGAIQDLNYDIALAQRLKATGAKILLDFHYSDTWADPGHQAKPAAWTSLTFPQLQTQVHDYTQTAMNAFKSAGVMPDMVQVGNETSNGMLFASGSVTYSGTTAQQQASWANFGALLNAGISGVRDAQGAGPRVPVAIHVDQGDWNGHPQFFFGNITSPSWANVSDFDIMGVSYYPSARSQRDFSYITSNLNALADTYPGKKIMVLEANYPWRTHTGLGVPAWASTQAGQQQFLTDLRNAIQNLHNGAGAGIVWWYPESIQVSGYNIYNGGDTALFDASGNALPALNAFSTSSPTWNVNADGTWYNAINWLGGVPMFTDNVANFGSIITSPRTVTLNASETAGTINFSNANSYTIAASGANGLTLQVSSGQAAINVTSGSHTISAPLTLASDTTISVAPTGSTLSITGSISASGRNITKTGSGKFAASAIRANSLTINSGSVEIIAGRSQTATSNVASLSIASGAALNLNDQDMIIDYSGSSPLVTIQAKLISGYNNGNWNGAGINSATAASVNSQPGAHVVALGYLDNATAGLATFSGQQVDSTSILIRYTLTGDADLSGTVDTLDFNTLASNFGLSGARWDQGDFNYDGTIDTLDFNHLALNFGQGFAAPIPIPEPASISALLLAALLRLRRRVSQIRSINSQVCRACFRRVS